MEHIYTQHSQGGTRGHTSSVRGGKNSKEKNGLPSLMDAFILSMTFMAANSAHAGEKVTRGATSHRQSVATVRSQTRPGMSQSSQ